MFTTNALRGANLELPPGKWRITLPLSGAIGSMRVFGMRLPRASRLQRFMEATTFESRTTTSARGRGHAFFQGLGPRDGVAAAYTRPAATATAFPRTSKPALSAAQPCRSGSGSFTSVSSKVPDGPRFWPTRRPPEGSQG